MSDQPFVTIYILCYGDYLDLHRRLFESLKKYLPKGVARVVVWGNQLSDASQKYVESAVTAFDDRWVNLQPENVPKYTLMRELWHENEETIPRTPWTLWLDDDTHITSSDWWDKTMKYIKDHEHENICYFGHIWFVHHLPGQWEFIEQSEWYRGVPTEMMPTRTKNVKKPGVAFANGGYVWLRSDVLRQINWPDKRLVHNGGDSLLGEAVRQQGFPRFDYHHGVKGNDARRRGRSDKPAGSNVDVRR
jgi:hypothetical protein